MYSILIRSPDTNNFAHGRIMIAHRSDIAYGGEIELPTNLQAIAIRTNGETSSNNNLMSLYLAPNEIITKK